VGSDVDEAKDVTPISTRYSNDSYDEFDYN